MKNPSYLTVKRLDDKTIEVSSPATKTPLELHLPKLKNGVVLLANGSTGCSHSCHPNIDSTGSVTGMKALGYWPKDARTTRAFGFIHNVSSVVCSDVGDWLAYYLERNPAQVDVIIDSEDGQVLSYSTLSLGE